MKRKETTHPNIILNESSGIYYARVKSRENSLETKDFNEALDRISYFLVKYDKLKNLKTNVRIKSVGVQYLKFREKEFKAGEIRIRTLNECNKIFNNVIFPLFGKYTPVSFDSNVWDEIRFKKKLKNQVNVRKTIQHFIKWCIQNHMASGVPILKVSRPKRRPRRILKPQEMKLIYGNAEGSLKIFIAMALFNGMRRTEIMTMDWERADLIGRSLFIPDYIAKTRKERRMPMHDEVLRLLTERLGQQQNMGVKTSWVFPHALDPKRHGDLSGLKTAWITCKRRSFGTMRGEKTEDITWHDLRATCEKYAHMNKNLSDTQLEKFFGADIKVQRSLYVDMDHEDLRGVEKSLGLRQFASGGKPVEDHEENIDVNEPKDAK